MLQGQPAGAAKAGNQAVRIAKGPDGTKGFAPGRGRPLPAPAHQLSASAPGAVRPPAVLPYIGPLLESFSFGLNLQIQAPTCMKL